MKDIQETETPSFLFPGNPVRWNDLSIETLDRDLEKGLKMAGERLREIRALSREEANDQNTLHALEEACEELERAWSIINHLTSVRDGPVLREKYREWLPRMSDFFSGISLDPELYEKIRWFSETPEALELNPVRKRLLSETLDSFETSGASLGEDQRQVLREIEQELASATRQFSENVLDSTNAWELMIRNPERLSGLPESSRAAALQSAREKGYGDNQNPVWRFTLQMPSMLPVLRYADDESLRREVWEASNAIGTGDHENGPLIARILELRRKKAGILGFEKFADLTTRRRMLSSGKEALSFVEGLHGRIREAFQKEYRELIGFRASQTGEPERLLEPWEVPYWSEKLRRERYDFDEEELRRYFPIEKVMSGMFTLAEKIFDLDITAISPESTLPPQVWHPDVRFYQVRSKKGKYLGAFYADWYPREDKRDGAWMNPLLTGKADPRGQWEPHLGLICGNMTPPVNGQSALLYHRDVETIFHEFGHLLHLICSEVPIPSLSGTAVSLDFVELPSQLMENWCWERESLDLMAAHHESGEPIPESLLEKMKRARNFQSAIFAMRQLSFGKMDLALHSNSADLSEAELDDFVEKAIADYVPEYLTARPSMLRRFSHLFSSSTGYAGGYYSYKWSEVLDADVFERFKREGILNPELGREFRKKILAMGNSKPPDELYRDFMGRDPDETALLRRSGIL